MTIEPDDGGRTGRNPVRPPHLQKGGSRMPVFELRDVSVGYGRFQVIREVSLSVQEGEFISLIGPNGAGKTTLIHAMSGALPVQTGRVLYRGTDVTSWKADARARAGIGQSFQRTNLFPGISALENVALAVLAKRGVRMRSDFSQDGSGRTGTSL